jgi:hypothetical protein
LTERRQEPTKELSRAEVREAAARAGHAFRMGGGSLGSEPQGMHWKQREKKEQENAQVNDLSSNLSKEEKMGISIERERKRQPQYRSMTARPCRMVLME